MYRNTSGLIKVAPQLVAPVFWHVNSPILLARKDNSVFAYPIFFVPVKFGFSIVGSVARREDFDNPFRYSQVAELVELGRVTDNADIRLHDGLDGRVAVGRAFA